MKRWLYRSYDPAVADRIQTRHQLPRLIAVLLAQRGVVEPDAVEAFLTPSLSALHDPYRLLGLREAVERLRAAIARREKILVYGDYDVDGTTSVVLLTKAIEIAGGRVDFHVPHRIREGYGMREDVIERAARDEVKLLISVDTGIREAAVVERARELGIDAILTDHHLPDEGDIPKALAVINPNQPGCSYPDKGLCGVGLAFKLAQALLQKLDWPPAKLQKMLRSMLKIVALGTIADLVPLTGENRVFARLGLEGLERPANPGLRSLLHVAGLLNGRPPTAGDIGFRVGPRINAAGRMDTARDVVELFQTRDPARAESIAQKLDGLNAERQQAEADVVAEIVESLQRVPPPDVLPFLVVDGEGWHPGVIGIAASRIVEQFHRPTLVLTRNPETGLATGSGRSIPAFHLLESLESVAPIFERFGGHRAAAGCTLRIERIPELREALNEYAVNTLDPDDFVPLLNVDAELAFGEITDDLMEQMARLAPFGMGNPTPVFAAADLRLAQHPRLLKEKHLKVCLEQEGKRFYGVGWRMAALSDGLAAGGGCEAAFQVEADDYWGGWRLSLKDLRSA